MESLFRALPMTDKAHVLIRLQQVMTEEIYRERPHFKMMVGDPCSFSNFILDNIDKERPVAVADLGSHNCYLASVLSPRMHSGSTFICASQSTTSAGIPSTTG